MIITDLNGVPIEVTDLDKALAQADSFRRYKHTDNTHKALDKRLKAYCNPQIIELKESKQSGEGEASERIVREHEGEEILSRITQNMYVITLEIKGKKLSSEQLAEKIESLSIEGKSDVAFVIGGSLGLAKAVSDRANMKLSFSDMTFPHQMMRTILLEQIYRSFKIARGEKYHK